MRSRTRRTPRDDRRGISILLIDDNQIFRMGLSALLKNQPGLRLLAAAAIPEPILQQGFEKSPDVILLDLGVGDPSIHHVMRGIQAAYPHARLIMMGMVPLRSEILELVRKGVSGFVLKDAPISDFVASIRAVADGQRVLPACLTDSLFSQIVEDGTRKAAVHSDVGLTRREREIVDLIEEGMSNKEIAARLHIAIDTVKSHVHSILEKLSLRSRVEVAVRSGRARGASLANQRIARRGQDRMSPPSGERSAGSAQRD